MSKPIKECKCQCGGGGTAKSSGVCGSRSGDKLASKLKRKTIGIEYESDESKENHEDASELVFDDNNSTTQLGCTCGAASASQDSFDRSANMLSGDDSCNDDDLPDHQKPQK